MLKKEGRVKRETFTVRNLASSIWFFPIILTILLILFTGLKISGSSLEVYNYILGAPQGRSLIANQPQSVRSDEWIVNTQLTVAQKNNNFARINENLGHGEDVSMSNAAPYKDWSAVFRPENLSFFVLPFNHAFAFSWWFMGYALMLSCYFFVLLFMPGKKLWAAFLSIALFFSPFVQWWYLYGTLGSLFYPLIIGILFVHILRTDSIKRRLLYAASLAYTCLAFALVLYPPFMIPCAFGIAAVGAAYLLKLRRDLPIKQIAGRLAYVAAALVIAILGLLIFFKTRPDAIHAITNTVYPGKRVSPGGGINIVKLFSGFLDTQLQNPLRAKGYGLNQSAVSNFLLIAPFLLLPTAYLTVKQYRKKKPADWLLIVSSAAFVVLVIRSLTTVLDPVLNILFKTAPIPQLIIGLGLLNILQIIFFIRNYAADKTKVSYKLIVTYSIFVLLAELALALSTHHASPTYIGLGKAIALSLPIPAIVYLLLDKKVTWALALFAIFSVYSSYGVNPLYHGTRPLTNTAIVTEIQKIGGHSDSKWISESMYYENFPLMSGVPSLSGTYLYPQLSIWKSLPPQNPEIYNRYAHVIFVIDHQANGHFVTHLEQQEADAFVVVTEPCSPFLRQNNVRYILAQAPIDNSCLKLRSTVPYPNQTFFIYEIR